MTEPIDTLQREVRRGLSEQSDHGRRLAAHDRHLAGQGRRLDQLDDRLDGLERLVGRHDVGRLVEEFHELRSSLDDLADEVRREAATVRAVQDRVLLLDRRLRSTGTVATAELDLWPADFDVLAARVRSGNDARAELLPEWQRVRWKQQIAEPERLHAVIRDGKVAALSAARAIATVEVGDPDGWRRAAEEWNTATTARTDAAASLPGAERAATDAQRRLDEAERRHRAAEPVVTRGEEALDGLLPRIRTRVSDALGKSLYFPLWFENILGPGAPAQDTEFWRDVAVDVVVYRVVNRIDDPVLALGERPVGAGWRREEHDRLSAAVRRFR